MKKESQAILNEFEKVVGSAYLNVKNGKSMTAQEMEEYKARMADITKNYSVSYKSRGFFRSSEVVIKDKK